ncbi:Multidrug resistance-associated protein 1 [Gryganskiella cystojenkinii]|nr:Multidrug resistance-associated protein 1 [Gryganskiella cystojenkinii]
MEYNNSKEQKPQPQRQTNPWLFRPKSGWIYWISQTCIVTGCAALVARIVQLSEESTSTVSPLLGTAALLAAWLTALVLNHLENQNDSRSSTHLFAFYVISLFAGAIVLRTMHDLVWTGQDQFVSFCVYYGTLVCGFIFEAWPRPVESAIPLTQTTSEAHKQTASYTTSSTAYDRSNLFSRMTFHYIQTVISKGYRQPLQDNDIANMMPRKIRTVNSYEVVSRTWERHLQKRRHSSSKGNNKYGKAPSLPWVVLKAGGRSWIPIIAFCLSSSVFQYLQPVLIDVILGFINSYSTDAPQRTSLGIIIAFGMFFTEMMGSITSNQFMQLGTNLAIELKSGLISMIYRKSLKLSPGARRNATVGDISNHMAVDVERIGQAMTYLPLVISSPFEIALGIWLLYGQLGVSAFTGLGLVILVMPIQTLFGRVLNTVKDKKLKAMDGRIRLMTDLLSGIKIVKLYSWEKSFISQVEAYRNVELRHLRTGGIVIAFMMIMYSSLPPLMALLSFLVFAFAGGPGGSRGQLDAQTIFVSLTLFGRLAGPIGRASSVISQAISFRVAAKRIERFLLQEELDETQIEYQEVKNDHTKDSNDSDSITTLNRHKASSSTDKTQAAILVENGTFSWNNPQESDDNTAKDQQTDKTAKAERVEVSSATSDAPPALSNINLSIDQGSLTVLMGRVGQGKSSLLSAIIGDMYKLGGRVRITGSVAYAWIINATLKDNILFGKELDQERYDHIVMACGLVPDFKMLPAGDRTEIGERGINLSGGQKQRVSLARAAYQDADIYLLDDPLSAVDAHVDGHLWKELIGPLGLLKDKTRLLVTHGIHHLYEIEQIVVIKDGTVQETGTYTDLMVARAGFYQLISEFSVTDQNAKESSELKVTKGQTPSLEVEEATVETDRQLATATGVVAKAETAIKKDENAELVLEEEAAEGSVSPLVYKHYAKATTYWLAFLSLFLFILSQASQIGISTWLQTYASNIGTPKERSIGVFFGVYAALVLLYFCLDIGVNIMIFVVAGLRASKIMHDTLIQRVLRLPMSFFDTTPVGRIMNRFSSDTDNVDELLPINISDFCFFLTSVLGTLIVISFSVPIFMALIPVLAVLYLFIQVAYLRSSRALKRIHSISKSPLYQHFGETLTGVSTIRAMRVNERFILENAMKSDISSNAYFAYQISSRWLDVRLECMGTLVVLATALLSVLARESLGAAKAGLALSYSSNLTFLITLLVKSYGEFQNQLVSVERIQEYSNKGPEAPATMDKDAHLPPHWPAQGRIEFRDFSARYRQGMELIIKGISFEVQPGEKVGIVGRTGAGKSSLTLALFRIIEAANGPWASLGSKELVVLNSTATSSQGTTKGKSNLLPEKTEEENDDNAKAGLILIDGIDIATIGLEHLRQHLAIIPQDPILFAGTVRDNLDPFNQSTDLELWQALEQAHLKTHITSLAGGLAFEVTQNGDNFSVGQRSLICLARALLRKTKILILDEATAAVDVETDELIQKTIRKEFADRTILTIAHRIKTVMDSDKILVLEEGCVKEFDRPEKLLENKESLFYQLAKQSGQASD